MSKLQSAAGRRPDPLFGEAGRNWGWMLSLGLFYLVLGAAGIAMLLGLTIVSILFIGALMLAGGFAQVLETFKCTGWKGLVWQLAIAALYIAGGLVVIYDPMSLSRLISLLLGGVLAAAGLVRILLARQLRASGDSWLWVFATGLGGLGLGAMIMLEWPLSGLFAIALFIAFELLLQGLSTIWLALTARRRRAAA